MWSEAVKHQDRQSYERAQFAALRSLLQSRPGPEAWGAVCKLAQTWRGGEFEQVERYIEDHIARWPDDVRTSPKRWRTWLGRGEDVPQLRLVRHLALATTHVGAPTPRARQEALLASPYLTQSTGLSLHGHTPDDEEAEWLLAWTTRQAQPLVRLELMVHGYGFNTGAPDALLDLMRAAPAHTLHLSLAPARLLAVLIEDCPLTRHLRHLQLVIPDPADPILHDALARLRLDTLALRPPWGMRREHVDPIRLLCDDPRLTPSSRRALEAYNRGASRFLSWML